MNIHCKYSHLPASLSHSLTVLSGISVIKAEAAIVSTFCKLQTFQTWDLAWERRRLQMRRQFSFQYPIRAALWSSLPLNIVEWSPFITAGPVQEGLQCIIRFYFHMVVASVLRYSGTNTDRGQVWAHSIRVLHSAEIFNIFGSNTHNMPLLIKGPTWVIWSLPCVDTDLPCEGYQPPLTAAAVD